MRGVDSQQVAEAREAGQPGLVADVFRTFHGIQIKNQLMTTRLGKHHGSAGDSTHADVLSGMHQPLSGQQWKQGKLSSKTLGRGMGRGIPEGVMAIETSGFIDQHPQFIAGSCCASGQDGTIRHTQNGNRERLVRALLVGVATHHGNTKAIARESHSLHQGADSFFTAAPDTVHQSQGTATHGRNVTEVDQHPTPAGKPGVFLNELWVHPLTGQQQLTCLSRHHRTVITEHPSQSQLWKGLMAKGGSS